MMKVHHQQHVVRPNVRPVPCSPTVRPINPLMRSAKNAQSAGIRKNISLSEFNSKLSPKKITGISSLAAFSNINSFNRSPTMSKVPSFNANTPEPKIFTIKIESNYGDPEKLSISSIHLLDGNRNPIAFQNIASVPLIDRAGLMNLTNQNLVKNRDEEWSTKFPPNEHTNSISIIFYIDQAINPQYLRLWNSRHHPDASAKNITVTNGIHVCYEGEVPRGFGSDIPLTVFNGINNSHSAAILRELFPELAPKPGLKDHHGGVPLPEIKNIKIEVISTWAGPTEENIGLNGIDIYDYNYNLIHWSEIEDVHIEGCKNFVRVQNLFRPNKESVYWADMFMGEVRNWENQRPAIEINLKESHRISRITIWNFNAETRSIKFGLKNINLRFDNHLIYTGKVAQASGRLGSVGYCTSVLWLTDVPEIRMNELE